MSSKPKVSVILPTYGRTDFLNQAINSVYDQTFKEFELIVVDDNDPASEHRKATMTIIERQKERGRLILYIQHEKNRNGAAARNTGIRYSRGDYLSFLDSDDFYLPSRLQKVVAAIENCEKNVGGVYTGVEFRRRGRTYNTYVNVRPGNFLVETLACRFMIGTGSNLFVKREVICELGGFDEDFLRHQDYEFLVRFFERYEMAACKESLVIKNNERFNSPKFDVSLKIRRQYLEKYRGIIDGLSEANRNYIIENNYSSLGELALKEGLRKESSKMYKIACRSRTMSIKGRVRRAILWILSWRA